MRSMQWQLGILGTVSAFAFRHMETKKNLCRDGLSQDLQNTDFQPAVRHIKLKKKQCPHSTTNTHNNTHKTTTTIHYSGVCIKVLRKITTSVSLNSRYSAALTTRYRPSHVSECSVGQFHCHGQHNRAQQQQQCYSHATERHSAVL